MSRLERCFRLFWRCPGVSASRARFHDAGLDRPEFWQMNVFISSRVDVSAGSLRSGRRPSPFGMEGFPDGLLPPRLFFYPGLVRYVCRSLRRWYGLVFGGREFSFEPRVRSHGYAFRVLRSTPDAVPCGPCTVAVHGAPGHNRWGVVETPCEDTRGTMSCPKNFAHQVLLRCVVFTCHCRLAPRGQSPRYRERQGPTVNSVVTSPGSKNGALR